MADALDAIERALEFLSDTPRLDAEHVLAALRAAGLAVVSLANARAVLASELVARTDCGDCLGIAEALLAALAAPNLPKCG